jgi:hypothetical protein
VRFSHPGNLTVILGATLGRYLAALFAKRSGWGLFQKIVSEMHGSGQQLIGTLGTALRQVRGYQETLCF